MQKKEELLKLQNENQILGELKRKVGKELDNLIVK